MQNQLAYFDTDAFLAERARDYGLVRAGEIPFVVREYTRGESSGRSTLEHLAAHAGSFPKVSAATRKLDDAIVAAADAGTSAPVTVTSTAGAAKVSGAKTASGAAIPATTVTPNT